MIQKTLLVSRSIRKSELERLAVWFQEKKIIIFGGAGFIGSHLCEELLCLGGIVKVVDNLSTGNLDNLRKFESVTNFSFSEGDVESFEFEDFDYVINLACPASPEHYQKNPTKTFTTSVLGVMNICKQMGSARLLHSSTSEIYGDPLEHPQTEKYWGNVNPIGPRSCYDEGKRAAETYLHDFSLQSEAEVLICRIFNTYGPNLNPNDGRVFSNFMKQASDNLPLTIYGDGTQTRSLCYVDDLVYALLALLSLSPLPCSPVNIGNDTEYTINEIARLIVEKTRSESKFLYEPLPIDDPVRRQPDLSLLVKYLNWKPTVTLSEGVDLCNEYKR